MVGKPWTVTECAKLLSRKMSVRKQRGPIFSGILRWAGLISVSCVASGGICFGLSSLQQGEQAEHSVPLLLGSSSFMAASHLTASCGSWNDETKQLTGVPPFRCRSPFPRVSTAGAY